MKKQKEIIGAIVEIPIKDYFVYAQILQRGLYCFFDYKAKCPITNPSTLISAPVMFIICVYPQMVNTEVWKVVGDIPIRDDLKILPNMYMQDNITKEVSLYHTMTGEITPSTESEISGLECCAVWNKEHIEDRIIAYYDNQPCIWLEALKIK